MFRQRGLILCVVAVVGLLGVNCGKNASVTQASDLEQELRDKERELSQLESSMGTLERRLAESEAQARESADAAKAAERAAVEAERAARKAMEGAESGSAAERSRYSSGSMVGGKEMLPPNARAGECYARVFVPPTYSTETERVLKREASDRIEIVPAEYGWGEERVVVKEASERLEVVPATYEYLDEKVLVKPAETVWKKGRGAIEKVDNGTGEIMCLVEEPAVYKTVKKRVLKTPAKTRKVSIPAEYKTVKVRTLVSPAKEKRITVPAEYTTLTKSAVTKEGRMEWRPVLCETNMARSVVMSVQRALDKMGHNPGPIDGIYGRQTMAAVRSFQQSKNMPTGGLTMGTLKALNVKM